MKRAKLGDVRGGCKLGLAKVSFIWRSANYFNKHPLDIRTSRKLEAFKVKVKPWILKNVANNKNTLYTKYNQVEKNFWNFYLK